MQSILYAKLRAVSIYVASPATSPENSAKLIYVTKITSRRRASINGNTSNAGDTCNAGDTGDAGDTGNAGDTGIVGLMESALNSHKNWITKIWHG